MRHGLALAIVGLTGMVGAVAVTWAQGTPAPPRVLHEDLPSPTGSDSPLIGSDPAAGQNPDAFASGDKVLPEPQLAPKDPGEPVFGREGSVTDRQTEERPDYQTGADGTLHYTAVFNPDVMPFKRMSSLDGIDAGYVNVIRDPTLRDLSVGGVTDRARDRFWASLMVELTPGAPIAIPSVAPDMRILSYETQPAIRVTFSKDSADNFYVRADDRAAHGQFRLVFLADADAGYFAPQLPTRPYSVRRVRELAQHEGLVPTLTPQVRQVADQALADLGLDEDDELGAAFNKLVFYFRAFEAKPIPAATGDVYWDLFKNQAGVCRHRSSTFTVTANALGIPTRYVFNEAHAFVEVWFPERGWQRIDLGGAASRLDVSNAENKTVHRPRAPDPFAKPPEYTQNYAQLTGDISGLTDAQLDEAHAPLTDAPPSGAFDSDGPGAGPGGDNALGDDPVFGPGADAQGMPIDNAKPTPVLTVTLADPVGYRGEVLAIEGRVDGPGGRGVGGLRIDLFLAPVGSGGLNGTPIGRSVSNADGTFAIDALVPTDLDLDTYELFVSTRGDARYNPAYSDGE
ncbi:MAG: transglutaminase domain-containing protein [Myxococcales bacterium]|nr:transglutaminase domain-containing protein [Myxococcales bacterium]